MSSSEIHMGRGRAAPRRIGCNNGGLTDDIIFHEILVRLPVKSLLRFKCVCKSWYALISSPHFINSHLQHAKKSPTLLIAPHDPEGKIRMHRYEDDEFCTKSSRKVKFLFDHKLPLPLDVFWFPGHSNGLILINTAVELILCNPSTRDYRALPRGSSSVHTWPNSRFLYGMSWVGFGFVPSINAYKVCQYFYGSYDEASRSWSIGFEVLTLGVDSSWRCIKEELLYPMDGSSPMSVGESIYFRMDKNLDTELPPYQLFFSFNLSDEKFRLVSLPPIVPNDRTLAFVELAGDTCFYALSSEGTKLDIWTKNHRDYGTSTEKDSWTHVFNIDLLQPYRGVHPVGMRYGKLLLRTTGKRHGLVFYNPRSKSLEPETDFDLIKDFVYYNQQQFKRRNSFFQVISYVESLVPATFPLLED